ncbi:endonuclease/exonuclease/phosphatase family protein [Streptomyces albidoflavus]|uniref:endonuclease/exonuclease/phosphatase family protein n=1 Tax=Streptomyces albidoflavus TaxID=1886 RepID=UPI00101E31F7|nr:endonuclease/exonuclease/phosphatase family protein [Streptomyces albidoflavus]RZD82246.1 endonuclease [Streptomyces albidoflavus]
MTTIRVANLNAYKLGRAARGTSCWNARVTAIREVSPDILALQEVVVDEHTTPRAAWDGEAATVIQDLAQACDLTAGIGESVAYPHRTAMASNAHRAWWTALLWNPDTVRLLPASYRPFGAPDFWHGCTVARFDIGAKEPLSVASYHGDPFRPGLRYDEAVRLKGAFRASKAAGGVQRAIIMGDFNSISAAEVDGLGGGRRFYDAEPYTDLVDHDDLEYQVKRVVEGEAPLADREPTKILLRRGFFVDAAAHLGAPWQPTVGHWEDGQGDPDPWGLRRIDLGLASRPVAPALTSYGAHHSAAARKASDHVPIWMDVNPSAIL